MARRVTRMGRTVVRRRDGVTAIRRSARWRRVLPAVAEGTFLVVPLVFALTFVLPLPLVPVPPLLLCLGAWLLFRRRRPGEAPASEPPPRSRVIALRSARARRGPGWSAR